MENEEVVWPPGWELSDDMKRLYGYERRIGVYEMLHLLNEIRAENRVMKSRLEAIEAALQRVEGAWWVARYLLALPAAMWGLYVWAKGHLV